jgi:hypothetical protein
MYNSKPNGSTNLIYDIVYEIFYEIYASNIYPSSMPQKKRISLRRFRQSTYRMLQKSKSITRKRTCGKHGIPSKRIIIGVFMEMLHAIKLYHWNTHSYAEHKATDELHERLSSNIDKFVEVLLGKDASRLRHLNNKIRLLNLRSGDSFKNRIHEYREFMIGLTECFHSTRDSDLLSIRDEILADLNQFLYLMTLDK